MTAGAGKPPGDAGRGRGPHRPTLCLVRHAKAFSRERWTGDDRERPLTERGHEQSRLLADHVLRRAGGPSLMLSSPAVRCRETLTPLAETCRLDIVETEWLDEGSKPGEALDQLRTLTLELDAPSGAGGPVAACTHGDVIWGILDLLSKDGVDLGHGAEAPKGGVWILGFRSKRPPAASFFVPRVPS